MAFDKRATLTKDQWRAVNFTADQISGVTYKRDTLAGHLWNYFKSKEGVNTIRVGSEENKADYMFEIESNHLKILVTDDEGYITGRTVSSVVHIQGEPIPGCGGITFGELIYSELVAKEVEAKRASEELKGNVMTAVPAAASVGGGARGAAMAEPSAARAAEAAGEERASRAADAAKGAYTRGA